MKKIFALFASLLVLLSLTACKKNEIKEENLIGTWSCSYSFDGRQLERLMIIEEDRWVEVTYEKGKPISQERGTYSIEGNIMMAYKSESKYCEYKYEDGTLSNGNYICYKKADETVWLEFLHKTYFDGETTSTSN